MCLRSICIQLNVTLSIVVLVAAHIMNLYFKFQLLILSINKILSICHSGQYQQWRLRGQGQANGANLDSILIFKPINYMKKNYLSFSIRITNSVIVVELYYGFLITFHRSILNLLSPILGWFHYGAAHDLQINLLSIIASIFFLS